MNLVSGIVEDEHIKVHYPVLTFSFEGSLGAYLHIRSRAECQVEVALSAGKAARSKLLPDAGSHHKQEYRCEYDGKVSFLHDGNLIKSGFIIDRFPSLCLEIQFPGILVEKDIDSYVDTLVALDSL